MSQPSWAKHVRDRGLDLVEVKEGFYIITKPDSSHRWVGEADSGELAPPDDGAPPSPADGADTKPTDAPSGGGANTPR